MLRAHLLTMVDECEVMTTDSHVVNTLSGRNPVGYRVTAEEFLPYVEDTVRAAIADLAPPAEAAGGTGWVEGVTVFGSNRISQLASTVNAMLTFIAPLGGVAILLFAFLLCWSRIWCCCRRGSPVFLMGRLLPILHPYLGKIIPFRHVFAFFIEYYSQLDPETANIVVIR